jgi:hypothetical protein
MKYAASGSYVGVSKYPCYCGELGDLWRSGTIYKPGRLFVRCGTEKVLKLLFDLSSYFGCYPGMFPCMICKLSLFSILFSQRCTYFGWEDELSGQKKGGASQHGIGASAAGVPEMEVVRQLRGELLWIRYTLVALVLVCVWIASRV